MAAVDTGILLSPSQRRLWDMKAPITYPGENADTRTRNQMDAKSTYECLRRAGWTPYGGPAQRDKRGFIVPGSDPRLRPEPPLYRSPVG